MIPAVLALIGHDLGWRVFAAVALVVLIAVFGAVRPNGRPWP